MKRASIFCSYISHWKLLKDILCFATILGEFLLYADRNQPSPPARTVRGQPRPGVLGMIAGTG
jgi:hypothetical protein